MTYPCNYGGIQKVYEKISSDLGNKSNLILKPNIIPSKICKASKWCKKPVKVLFIAESPPWSIKNNGDVKEEKDCKNEGYVYFYNEKCKKNSKGLAGEIFRKLDIAYETREDNLSEFCRRHFFLTDSIKCVVKKNGKNLERIVKKSAIGILDEEIRAIHPDFIALLGRTALEGLKKITVRNPCVIAEIIPQEGLKEELEKIKFTTFTPTQQECLFKSHKIILMPFPNDRTKGRYSKLFENGFGIIKRLDIKKDSF